MKDININILGLNHKDDDEVLISGYCRLLKNLYPSGNVDKPIWKLINSNKEIYGIENEEIVWLHILQNIEYSKEKYYLIIITRIKDNNSEFFDKLKISYVIFDYINNNFSPASRLQTLKIINDYFPKKYPINISHTKINHKLYVCIYTPYQYKSVIYNFYIKNQNVIIEDININQLINSIQVILHEGMPYINENDKDVLRYIGFRFALETNDGTYINASAPIITPAYTLMRRRSNGAVEFIGIYNLLLKNIEWIKTLPENIKGIAMFMSLPEREILNIIDGGKYYYVTTIVQGECEGEGDNFKWDYMSNKKDYFITEARIQELLANKLYENDNLNIYKLSCNSIAGYNNSLLLINTKFQFPPPSLTLNLGIESAPSILPGWSESSKYVKSLYLQNEDKIGITIIREYPNVTSFGITDLKCSYDNNNHKLSIEYNIVFDYWVSNYNLIHRGDLNCMIDYKWVRRITTIKENPKNINIQLLDEKITDNVIVEKKSDTIRVEQKINFEINNIYLEPYDDEDEFIRIITYDMLPINVDIYYQLIYDDVNQSTVNEFNFKIERYGV